MQVSQIGLDLIASFEGFSDKAYLCPANVWTIGYGTTVYPDGKKVAQGDTITKEKAIEYLKLQAQQHADTIEKYIRIKLTQNQYDALASFQYNLGKYILSKDKALASLINSRSWDQAAERLQIYNKGGGKVLPGLVRRRKVEAELFLKDTNKAIVFSRPKLVVDGQWGRATTRTLQAFLGLSESGIIHGQSINDVTRSIDGVEIGRGGSSTVRNLQKLIGATADGYLGPNTIRALQKYLGTPVDGRISNPSTMVKALQTLLNNSL